MAMSIAGLGAQTPQQPPAQPPTTQPPATQAPAAAAAPQDVATTTIQGCVYKEQDIPGRTPDITEKAGVLEDYILVASVNPSTPTGTSGTAGTAGVMAAPKAFKLEKIADEQLRAVVGKRVEVTGRVDAERGDKAAGTAGAPAPDKNMGPDKIELSEFEVTSMREVEGTCPASPMIRK